MRDEIDFESLRNQWALRYHPSESRIQLQRDMDHRANPHNEPYHNKRPRRTDDEIISDLCFDHADSVLKRQYGNRYMKWLEVNYTPDRWTLAWRATP